VSRVPPSYDVVKERVMSVVKQRSDSPMRVARIPVDDAYQDGYSAYWRSIGLDDNPHPPGTEGHVSWCKGWRQAQVHESQE
jgi:hypothetical protein